jgi:hypothetical protein
MVLVERKKPNCTFVVDRVFYPGMTALTDVEYDQFKDLNAFKSEIACGNMVIAKQIKSTTKATGATSEERIANEVKGLDLSDAVLVAGGILDITTLRLIKEVDSRPQVQSIVDTQITELTSGRK